MNEITNVGTIEEIKTLHDEVTEALRAALPKAIRIGELLTETKASLQHGEWGEWCEKNLPFTARTASNYMKVFANQHQLESETVSDLSGAYRMLSAPKKKYGEIVPAPGCALIGDIDDKDGSFSRFCVYPSEHEGFYYLSYIWSEGQDAAAIVEGTKKPIREDSFGFFFEKTSRYGVTEYEWNAKPMEPQKYNLFLYDSHEDYVQRAILGREAK